MKMGTKRNITICFGVLLVLTSMLLPAASATKYWVVGNEFKNVLVIVDMDDIGGYIIDPLDSNEIDLDVYVDDGLEKRELEYSDILVSDKEIILVYDKSAFEGINLEPGDELKFTFNFGEGELGDDLDVKIMGLDSESSKKDKVSENAPGQIKKE
ncbi:TPA: hypothetical protein HA351_06835 [Methanosarcinaceae archaeon]|nr:hypothetical protein [Methanosarcinaceae archaeon]